MVSKTIVLTTTLPPYVSDVFHLFSWDHVQIHILFPKYSEYNCNIKFFWFFCYEFCRSTLYIQGIYRLLWSGLATKSNSKGTPVRSHSFLNTFSIRLFIAKLTRSTVFTNTLNTIGLDEIWVIYLHLQILFLGNLGGERRNALDMIALSFGVGIVWVMCWWICMMCLYTAVRPWPVWAEIHKTGI